MTHRHLSFLICLLGILLALPALAEVNSPTISVNADLKTGNAKVVFNYLPDVIAPTAGEISDCIAQLSDGENTTRVIAVARLIKVGAPAVPLLKEALVKSTSAVEVTHISLTLLGIGTKEANAALRTLPKATLLQGYLESNDNSIKSHCAMFLAMYGDDKAVTLLRAAFTSDMTSERVNPIMMGAIFAKRTEFIPEIERCLYAADEETRLLALMAYYRFQGKKGLNAYVAKLADPNQGAQFFAMWLIKDVDPAMGYEVAVSVLLTNPSAQIRASAATLLVTDKRTDTIPVLIQASHDADAKIRAMVAVGLGKFPKDATARQALLSMQDDTDAGVKSTAKKALAGEDISLDL